MRLALTTLTLIYKINVYVERNDIMKKQYNRPQLSIEEFIVEENINLLSVIKDWLDLDEEENYDGIIWE